MKKTKKKVCNKCNGHGYLEGVAYIGDIECDVKIRCPKCGITKW